MKKGYSEIVFILDRSGSMAGRENDVIGGFNSFIDEQKKVEGEASVTYIQFDDRYEKLYECVPINCVARLTKDIYVPRGMTALHDAICKTVKQVGERLAKTPENERPENVIVVIVTDGMENDSKEFKLRDVKRICDHQQTKYNWKFIYLGANQDAFEVGNQMFSISRNSVKYTFDSKTSQGVYNMFAEAALPCVFYRGVNTEYIDKVYDKANDLTKEESEDLFNNIKKVSVSKSKMSKSRKGV